MQQSRTDFDEAAPRTEVTTHFNPADHLGFSKIAAWVFREVIRFGVNSDVVTELSTDPSAEPDWLFLLARRIGWSSPESLLNIGTSVLLVRSRLRSGMTALQPFLQ